MNLIIVTPVNMRSAIARSTNLIVKSLRKLGHAVSIIRSECGEQIHDQIYDFGVDVHYWSDAYEVKSLIAESDLVVYELGNNFQFHQGCLNLMQLHPGLVILHDFFLADLFYGYFQGHIEERLVSLLQSWYGDDVTDRFFSAINNGTFYEFASQYAPMTEIAVDNALGVICHSHWGMDRVLNACGGPVAFIPLAYDAPFVTSAIKRMPRTSHRRLLLTFGHINSNKRARSIISAIGQDAILQKHWLYRLVGLVSETEQQSLQTLADQHCVQIEFTGPVSDEALAQEIVNADIVSCLRYPALEASSASTIEAMLYGKVVMVTDTGFYQELPDECVIKISVESEVRSIQDLLYDYEKNEGSFLNYEKCAQEWANKTFNADSYAANLIEVATHVLRSAPINAAMRSIGGDLLRWGVDVESPIIQDVLDPVRAIFSQLMASSLAAPIQKRGSRKQALKHVHPETNQATAETQDPL